MSLKTLGASPPPRNEARAARRIEDEQQLHDPAAGGHVGAIPPTAAPRVSVVIPAYKAQLFIGGALDAVVQQTLADCEIIVVDDCSPDETYRVIERLAEREPRLHAHRLDENGGPGAARNFGFEVARGDWICLLDADDSMDPGRLERLVALADQTGADMVSDNLLLCPEDGGPERPMTSSDAFGPVRQMGLVEFVEGNIFYKHVPERVSLGFMQPLISRAFLERHGIRYTPGVRSGEDFILALTCLAKGAKWWITPEAGYRYTIRKGSMTERQTHHDLGEIIACEEAIIASAKATGDLELVRVLRRHKLDLDRPYLYRRFTGALKRGQWSQARAWLGREPYASKVIFEQMLKEIPTLARKVASGGFLRQA